MALSELLEDSGISVEDIRAKVSQGLPVVSPGSSGAAAGADKPVGMATPLRPHISEFRLDADDAMGRPLGGDLERHLALLECKGAAGKLREGEATPGNMMAVFTRVRKGSGTNVGVICRSR